MTDWVVGGLVAAGGILAPVFAARAVDPVLYWPVLYWRGFGLIRRNFERGG